MKTGYITDRFSTLGGLASVAYGDPEYFREVQNQVYLQSPTRFADIQRPSDIFESFFGAGDLLLGAVESALGTEYQNNQEFRDLSDIVFGAGLKKEIMSRVGAEIVLAIDSSTDFGLTLSDYVGVVMSKFSAPQSVTTAIVSSVSNVPGFGVDAQLISRVVSNNPQTKISVPPPDSRVDLENSVDLGTDYRGVGIAEGYITPQEYWSDVAFSGMSTNNFPTGLADSVKAGYVGYSSTTPLEGLYNPVGAQSIQDLPSGATPSILDQFPQLSQADRDVYSISLMGETLNGYTSFDPSTMSNGDLVNGAMVPDADQSNSDPSKGVIPSSRPFTRAF